MTERVGPVSRRGRALKRPRQVYEPPSDFEDDEPAAEECIEETEEEEEEEDEDTDLSGFIAPDDEDESYTPSEDEEDDDDSVDSEAQVDPFVVTRDNLIDKLMEFSETAKLPADTEDVEVLEPAYLRAHLHQPG